MLPKQDAHTHFFNPGNVAALPVSCRRTQPDEVTVYSALAQAYHIQQVLAVGYEGAEWAKGNNHYLVSLSTLNSWIRSLAYVVPAQLTVAQLETWKRQGFIGISLYLFETENLDTLSTVSDESWAWLASNHWLLSINSTGDHWLKWRAILERHPDLRLLISHLGLPPRAQKAPSLEQTGAALTSVTALSCFPRVYVKLSGFYALSEPGYDYPHRSTWPYVERLLEHFGVQRLLWGSDFSPSLEWVSFPQTFSLISEIFANNKNAVEMIINQNLAQLLAEV